MKYLIMILLTFACSTPSSKQIDAWGIQLQKYEAPYDLNRIKNAPVKMWVMDYSFDGDHEFTPLEVELMKNEGSKKIISYLSIGELETYRFYYPTVTSKVKGAINPLWKNNLTANFWEKEWHNIIVEQYLPKIVHAHFDGVFLDVVDAFERFSDKAAKAEEMADLIIEISRKARSLNKNFIVILQNGLQIRRYLKDPERLMEAIDGVNSESTFFAGAQEKDNAFKENPQALEDIIFYQKHSKFVLSLEYLEKPELMKKYFEYAKLIKVIPLAAEKNLKGSLSFPESK